jgi:hypothetical protein
LVYANPEARGFSLHHDSASVLSGSVLRRLVDVGHDLTTDRVPQRPVKQQSGPPRVISSDVQQ